MTGFGGGVSTVVVLDLSEIEWGVSRGRMLDGMKAGADGRSIG